jgi:hypothetical protein
MFLGGTQTDSLSCVAFDVESRVLIAGGGMMTSIKHRPVNLRELIAWELPSGQVRWQVFEEADARISYLTARPGVGEFATKCSKDISIWSADGKLLRSFDNEFLGGPIVFSPDGGKLVAPRENVLRVRSSELGQVVANIRISESTYTSATCAAFVFGTTHLAVGASVISQQGKMTGRVLLVDSQQETVLGSADVEMIPRQMAVDPNGRWACIVGERRNRGWILFWDLQDWKPLAEQGAHGSRIDDLAVAPDGLSIATTGTDHVIRIWSTETFKTVRKLEEHAAEGMSGGGIAWSPDGNYIAFASGGKAPWGGVFLYARTGMEWKLFNPQPSEPSRPDAMEDLRHLIVYGNETTMDTVGDSDLLLNRWPIKCPRCTFPDLSTVPTPYLLGRGISAPGDYSSAALGCFFVRGKAKRIIEIAAPGACRFFPTYEAKKRTLTDWYLAVPQAEVQTKSLPEKYKKCPECREPKAVSHLEAEEFSPPAADIFRSKQWTCSQIGEETPWYLEDHLRLRRDQVPQGQWTRLCLDRELWMSSRLLLLLKHLKVKGLDYSSTMSNRKPTPSEAQWIEAKILEVSASGPVAPLVGSDHEDWFKDYLRHISAESPLATREDCANWEKKHKIKLPAAYVEFITRVGEHSFADMQGREGYDVRILPPNELDADGFRRDAPEDPSEEAEPDGVLCAVAINGDGLCFDVRSGGGKYPVYHFNHETESFEPFAGDFIAAVRRLVERN